MAQLFQARIKACELWKLNSYSILSMTPIERRGLGTMAVDNRWRLYYDPEFLRTLTIDESGGIICHEVSHLIFKHHDRCQDILGEFAKEWQLDLWNIAADKAINSILKAEGVPLPKGGMYPDKGREHWAAEQHYFADLREYLKREREGQKGKPSTKGDDSGKKASGKASGNQQQEGSEPSDDPSAGAGGSSDEPGDNPLIGPDGEWLGEPQTGQRGSCSDGRPRPWELPADDATHPGLNEREADILIRQFAERVLSKAKGTGRGGMTEWAKDLLVPKVDPVREFAAMVRHSLDITKGYGDYSMKRPNHAAGTIGDMIIPGHVAPLPRITVVIDTSGSMGKDEVATSIGLVSRVISGLHCKDGVRVICGDTVAQTAAKVFNARNIVPNGGGGTDMSALLVAAADEKPRPQLIVLCTDAETDWPNERLKVPVVACITRNTDGRWFDQIPKWIKVVKMPVPE